MYPYILVDNSLSTIIDGKPYSVNDSHPNWSRILEAIRNNNWAAVPNLIDIPQAITGYSKGLIEIRGGELFYDGYPLHSVLVDRILRQFEAGFDIDPMVNFLEKLQQNPVPSVRNELFEWLENADCPIHADGDFLAWKYVRDDYRDFHTGTFDYSVGRIVEVEEDLVDRDRDHTCSRGLHFCSRQYLPYFADGHGRCMVVKINPKDVRAFPRDHNTSKGRAVRMFVYAENHEGYVAGPLYDEPVFDPKRLGEETVYGRKFKLTLRALTGNGEIDEWSEIVRARNADQIRESYDEIKLCADFDIDQGGYDEDEIKLYRIEPVEQKLFRVRAGAYIADEDEWVERTILVAAEDSVEARQVVQYHLSSDDVADIWEDDTAYDTRVLDVEEVVEEEPEPEPTPAAEASPNQVSKWWHSLFRNGGEA